MDKKKRSTLLRLMSFIKIRWFTYTLGLIGCGVFNLIFNSIAAISLKWLTDGIVSGNKKDLFDSLTIISVGFGTIAVIIPFFIYSFNSSVKRITGQIRKTLFEHIQRLPTGLIESRHSGDLISRLNNDIQVAEKAYGYHMEDLLGAIITGIGLPIILFVLNWKIAIFTISFGLISTWINVMFAKKLRIISREIQNSYSSLTQRISDLIAGNSVIKIFNLHNVTLEKYRTSNEKTLELTMRRVLFNSYLSGFNSIAGFMSFLGVILLGSFLAVKGEITFGTIIAATQIAGSVGWTFRNVGSYVTQIQSSIAGAERIFEILDMPVEEVTGPKISVEEIRENIKKENLAIEFANLSFYYDEEKTVLSNLNLKVYKEQVVAVVGSSGSGKSTIYKLLLNFYKPIHGEIKIFGTSISSYRTYELRNIFAYVPQENYLFNISIAENIEYGKIGASMDEIINVAKMANAHDFIMGLPEGYNTNVGERGAFLSGGQRQRIAIARALLKDAPILLLDEATSALDSESEQKVQEALRILMKGRTTIVVAHRLSTVLNADNIIVLENGNMLEEGNHDSLMAKNENYAKLYNLQIS